jgi:HPt (histidine-containing phosphotransfer) domain-containing protein
MYSTEKINLDAIHGGAPEAFSTAVDLTVLASYDEIQLDGEPDLIVELIDLYRDDAPRRVGVMRKALAQRNWFSLKREAHSLRGSSGNLGANQMALLCGEIEAMESGNLFPSVEALLSRLEQELERVLRIFFAERLRRLQ